MIDLIILPKSKNGKTILLHIVDVWSGYNILRVADSKSAIVIAKLLWNVMRDHGVPRKIITDKGSEFINKHFKEIFEEWCACALKGGSPYHPETQGVNERRHKLIRDLLQNELNLKLNFIIF